MIGSIVDNFLDWALGIVLGILLLLPESPIQAWAPVGMGQFSVVLGWINYFLPLAAIAGIMTTYVAAVLVWYGIRWVLRIVQYID